MFTTLTESKPSSLRRKGEVASTGLRPIVLTRSLKYALWYCVFILPDYVEIEVVMILVVYVFIDWFNRLLK